MSTETPYGLARPTLDEARAAVYRVHGGDAPMIWHQLMRAAGLTGQEPDGIDRILPLMAAADPTTRLCATALRIRVVSHTYLLVAHSNLRSLT